MRLLFIFFYFISFYVNSFAQNLDCNAIEKEYRYTLNKIEKGNFFLNEYRINANRFALDEPDYFQNFEKYYYTLDKREGKNNKPILKAIILRKEKNKVNYYYEYFFDNNSEFIFYSEQKQSETSLVAQDKIKFFFQKEIVLKWFKNESEMKDKSEDPQNKVDKILKDVKKMKKKFDADVEKLSKF
ncbi:MAG: hypothetical protein EAZ85_06295 [Bacteroidetes bacterium]|nr:MAG: hypothetical protein EAZ85_06295 [Bacteroidota bacterium]TAG86542.1 MAG: hypothetical protein EAZ20_12555 [Bacteroidota bacterium]